MVHLQGPSLLAFNDALFAPSDFDAIRCIGQDGKTTRPGATGRFGLGFNAVYHFTDLPTFVSGDYLVLFDPHARHLPNVSPSAPGLKIDFARAQLSRQFPDAAAPFMQFGCDLQQRFNGTLFRFPLRYDRRWFNTQLSVCSASNRGRRCRYAHVMYMLCTCPARVCVQYLTFSTCRTEATAPMSDIKATPYPPSLVRRLFASLQALGPASLLFLKSVCRLELYARSGDAAPQLLYECSLQAMQVRHRRDHLLHER